MFELYQNKTKLCVLSMSICVGLACSSALAVNEVQESVPMRKKIVQAGHIYYNIVTGEQVVTLGNEPFEKSVVSAASSEAVPVWSVLSGELCPEGGSTSAAVALIDPDQYLKGAILSDVGEIELDTVVDVVRIHWVTDFPDADSNSDGIGDGVVGLAGEWTFWDADNGRSLDACNRLPVVAFRLVNLPGNVASDGFLSGYTADIDLGGSFSSSLTFELGDSDGDLQGAAFGSNDVDTDSDGIGDGVSVANADRNFDGLPDSDLDGDGLFDWAWTVQFFDPGTTDHDGDGQVDGVLPVEDYIMAQRLALPEGQWIDQGDGSWSWGVPDPLPSDYGFSENWIAVYDPIDMNWAFGISFAGPACDSEGYTPMAQMEMQLSVKDNVLDECMADLNGDGVLNFFDISVMLSLFDDSSECDYNLDGDCNFFDISDFLSDYRAGCSLP